MKKFSKGVTTVELLFFVLMFTLMEFALLGFVNLTMQHAIREGARYAITGRVNLDPRRSSDRKSAVMAKIRQQSLGFFDYVSAENRIKVSDVNGRALVGFGRPGDTIVVRMDCTWDIVNPISQMVLGKKSIDFEVTATMRNELYPTAES